MNHGKIPPYSSDAESAVLGSVFLDNSCWGQVFSSLNEEDFYLESNRRVFRHMYKLFEDGVPVDHVTLGNSLRQSGDLEKIGGVMALNDYTEHVATLSNISYYANIVREKSATRRVIYNAQNLVSEGMMDVGVDGLSKSMEELLKSAQMLARTRMPDSLLDMGEKVMANYKMVANGYRGIELPWPSMDAMTAGLWPKTVTMFVARPGTGKCLRYDTLVMNSNSGAYFTIEDIVKSRMNILTRNENGSISRIRPDAWLSTGRKQCVAVSSHGGRKISGTPEHPLMTPDGWKRIDELQVGEYIEVAGSVPEPYFTVDADKEEAIILGMMLADGGLTGGTPRFNKKCPIVSRVLSDAVQHYGWELVNTARGKLNGEHSIISNGDFFRWWDKKVGHRYLSKNKIIPNRVFGYSNENLSTFIGAMWSCDGSFPISKNGQVTAEISFASKEMVEQVQRLMLRFGIHGRIRSKVTILNGKKFNSWSYTVYSHSHDAFVASIPILGDKAEKLARLSYSNNPNIGGIPITGRMKKDMIERIGKLSNDERVSKYNSVSKMLGMTTRISANKLYRRKTVSSRVFSAFVEVFGWDHWRHLLVNRWDKIIDIKDDGVQDVYDLTVMGTHNFLANDIVAHNTFVAVVCARHAWQNGKKVLIVSPEMSKDEIAERFFVIHAGVSYHNVITGQLATIQEQKLKDSIDSVSGSGNLWIMDSDDDLSPKGMEAAIRACQPDMVAIDSIYDIKVSGDRKDRALGALEWMKRCAKDLGFAAVGFAQQNRSAELSEKKGGGARLGTIALADEIGQDAHAVFALEQSKDEKDDKKMSFKPLKLRRGQYKKPKITVNWDFESMVFDEIVEEEVDGDFSEEIPF